MEDSETDKAIREHIINLLRGKGAHIDFESVIAEFPLEWANGDVEGIPYTAWHVLEHMRIAQWDILQFMLNPRHVSPKWPEGYWPEKGSIVDSEAWEKSIEVLRTDLKALEDLVSDSGTDLLTPLSHGDGQTVMREVLLVADHNSYHLGVLVTMKRILEQSKKK